jgi:hypothetical protein
MAMRYRIPDGQTVSEKMSWDHDGALARIRYFDGSGAQVFPAGQAKLFASIYDSGEDWRETSLFTFDEWRFNGPCSRARIDLSGVTGYTTYEVTIWRMDDPIALIPSGAFTGGAAMAVQATTEMNAKLGLIYEASRRVTALASGAVLDSILVTGQYPVILKSRLLSYTGDGITPEIFESPTYTGGAADPYYNLSRTNPVASDVVLLAGPTLSVSAPGTKAFADDYLISGGTGATRGGSLRSITAERVLKPNTPYLLRQTMLSAQDIAAYISWYSGPLDVPVYRS